MVFVVDSRNKAPDRSSLSSSNSFERTPKGVLQGDAGFMPVEIDAPFKNRFPASGFGWRHWQLFLRNLPPRSPAILLPIIIEHE